MPRGPAARCVICTKPLPHSHEATMTPDQIAKAGTEHAHQCALFAAIALAYPLNGPEHALHWLYAIHNKGHGDAIRGAKARAEGVKAGVPDLCLPVPMSGHDSVRGGFAKLHHMGAYIELKTPEHLTHKNGHCSPDQIKWIRALRRNGYYVTVAFGWQHAMRVLVDYIHEQPSVEFDKFVD